MGHGIGTAADHVTPHHILAVGRILRDIAHEDGGGQGLAADRRGFQIARFGLADDVDEAIGIHGYGAGIVVPIAAMEGRKHEPFVVLRLCGQSRRQGYEG